MENIKTNPKRKQRRQNVNLQYEKKATQKLRNDLWHGNNDPSSQFQLREFDARLCNPNIKQGAYREGYVIHDTCTPPLTQYAASHAVQSGK